MLIFNLRSGTLTRVDNLTTATDSESYPTVRVNKYDDWPGTTIVARFVGGEDKDVYDVIVQNDICTVPGEIMTQKAFYISFKGISGSTIITTNQVKIKNAYSGFDLDAEEPATPTPDLITQLINSVAALRSMVGTPLVASTAAGMTDTSKIYVYTGSETGYTAGNWYYYDGSEWRSGGVYNSTAINTDTTLSVSGAAADSKTVGDSIGDLTQLNTTDKTSLVGAINEVGDEVSDLKSDIRGLIQEYEDVTPMTYSINQNRINIIDAFYTVKNGYMCKVIVLEITTSSITSANTWTLGNLSPYANLKFEEPYIDYEAVSLNGKSVEGMTFRQSQNTTNNFMLITTGAVAKGQGGVIMLTHNQPVSDPRNAIVDTAHSAKLTMDTQMSADLYNPDFASANFGWRVATNSLATLNGYSFVLLRVLGGSSLFVKGLSESIRSYGYAVLDSNRTVLDSGGESNGMVIDIPNDGYWLVFTYPSNDNISLTPYYKKRVVVLGDSWSDNDPEHTTYTKWTTLLQQDGRYDVKVYAQNGSHISGDTPNYGMNGNVLGQFEKLKEDNLKSVDMIVLMGGINDFRSGVSDSAVYNKLQYFYTELNVLYPTARIIYISNNQIYITQEQMNYFNVIVYTLRNSAGMEAYTSFGWVRADHYISDQVHVDDNGYKDLYANVLSILEGGQLHSVVTSYQREFRDESDNLLFTLGLYEAWDDGKVSYSARLTVNTSGLGKSVDLNLSAGDGNLVASVPFTKKLNKAFANFIGVDNALIWSDVAESFSTANKKNTSNHIKIIIPSANSGFYFSDNYN